MRDNLRDHLVNISCSPAYAIISGNNQKINHALSHPSSFWNNNVFIISEIRNNGARLNWTVLAEKRLDRPLSNSKLDRLYLKNYYKTIT